MRLSLWQLTHLARQGLRVGKVEDDFGRARSKKQRADILTKALVDTGFKAHRGFLMNLHVWMFFFEFASVILMTDLHELLLLFSAGWFLWLSHAGKTLSSRVTVANCVSMAGAGDDRRPGKLRSSKSLTFCFRLVIILDARLLWSFLSMGTTVLFGIRL